MIGQTILISRALYLIHTKCGWRTFFKIAGSLLLVVIGAVVMSVYQDREQAQDEQTQRAQKLEHGKAIDARWSDLQVMVPCPAESEVTVAGDGAPFSGQPICHAFYKGIDLPVSVEGCAAVQAKYPGSYTCRLPPASPVRKP